MTPAPILFYDGECGLCARLVRWSLARDRRGVLRFAPLQGETFARLAAREAPRERETVVLSDESGVHVESEAVLRLFRHLGGAWGAAGVLGRAIPRPLRDAVYRLVARHRITWFGTADRCALPAPSLRDRFLP